MDRIRPLNRLEALLNVAAPDGQARWPAIVAVLREHGEQVDHLGPAQEKELLGALDRLRALLRIEDIDLAAEHINRIFDDVAARPRLSKHDGTPWHVHVDPEGAGWGTWLLASSALALAAAIQEHGRRTWGQCEAESCERYYVGDGRGGERHYCSARCASRARVARHRGRARNTAPAPPPGRGGVRT
ncbi:CGNR zinc finger domain-containing protein [Phytoactinopolyspora alkaliphila]|uniref:CGNR zinc finger domain-containing protein n=1 Tax=Phytoactinopolyspora alkaliphila TaxID=1783498 RepID=UPI001C207A66